MGEYFQTRCNFIFILAIYGIQVKKLVLSDTQLKGQTVLGMESPSTRMNRLGRGILMGVEIRSLDGMLKQIDAITFEQVLAVAKEFYDASTWSAVCIGPEAEPFKETVGGFSWSEGEA